MVDPIKIDVWSDVACPWCYIGKRKLEAGLAAFAEDVDAPPIEVEFHSFELMPDTPEDVEVSAAHYLADHLGVSETRARAMQQQVASIAATVGLAYDFGRQQPANTRAAHQVLHLAKAHGRQAELKERLLSAHFVEGRHIGRHEELADLAVDVGLDREEVLRSLQEEDHVSAVDADIQQARQLGITGVPFFVIEGRFGIPGAQDPDVFTRALHRVLEAREEGSAA